MIYRMLAPTSDGYGSGDYSFGNGLNNFVTGVNAVAQAVFTRLYLLYGEWWEDTEDGLPLWQKVIGIAGSTKNIAAVDLIFQTRISETTGVKRIVSYTSNWDSATRKYSFTCTIDTDYGTTTLTV
jgi:hypothetical protein